MNQREVMVSYLRRGDLVEDWENPGHQIRLPGNPEFTGGTDYQLSVPRSDSLHHTKFAMNKRILVYDLPPPVEVEQFIASGIALMEKEPELFHGHRNEMFELAARLGLNVVAEWIDDHHDQFIEAMRRGYVAVPGLKANS